MRARPPTPRSPRCASAARRATTAWPRGWSATSDGATAGSCSSCSRCAGRCASSRATRRARVAALCVDPRQRRPLARRPPRAVAVVLGRALGARRRRRGRGRREPGRTRSSRELDEEWSVAPERLQRRGARAPAPRPGDARRPGVAARGRRGRARRRARRVRLVAAPTSPTGPTRPTSRCGAMATLLRWTARASTLVVRRLLKRPVVHPLDGLRVPAGRLARPRPARRRVRLRPGPRPRLDRDVRCSASRRCAPGSSRCASPSPWP